jgi:hypothetical protein
MLLATEIRMLTLWWVARDSLIDRARNERGDTYSGVLWVAVGVVIAVTVGGILYGVFVNKANSIDVNTPTVGGSAP